MILRKTFYFLTFWHLSHSLLWTENNAILVYYVYYIHFSMCLYNFKFLGTVSLFYFDFSSYGFVVTLIFKLIFPFYFLWRIVSNIKIYNGATNSPWVSEKICFKSPYRGVAENFKYMGTTTQKWLYYIIYNIYTYVYYIYKDN